MTTETTPEMKSIDFIQKKAKQWVETCKRYFKTHYGIEIKINYTLRDEAVSQQPFDCAARIVCDVLNMQIEDYYAHIRVREPDYVYARDLVILICIEELKFSLKKVATGMQMSNHTSVMAARDRTRAENQVNVGARKRYEAARNEFNEKYPVGYFNDNGQKAGE